MRSHHTGKGQEEAGGFEMDYTDTLWFPTAIKNYCTKENTYTVVNRSRGKVRLLRESFLSGER